MNTKLPYPFCLSKKGYIYIYIYPITYQCLECKRVVEDCCSGEVINFKFQKELKKVTQ